MSNFDNLAIFKLCSICEKDKTHPAWCHECGTMYFKKNFVNWTSGNQKIDEIIKETQMNSKFATDFVEWIPYKQFEKIEKISYGGFGTIYSAIWKQGPLRMIRKEFKRTKRIQVALKGGISPENLKELRMHIKCCTTSNIYASFSHKYKIGRSPILRCYGLTKRPISEDNDEYMLVIQFAKDGDLLKYLSKNFKLMKWFEDKLPLLAHIAYGIKIIHKEGLTHRDLHCGNILINNNISYISDFGLSQPYDHENSITHKLFGASDNILMSQSIQDAEHLIMQNTFNSLYSKIDLSLISTTNTDQINLEIDDDL
ncbi:45680_t:CDS:2 [Gigaspora margarita]|uniref:non-specific serine/threonine protein kinase n=1 Tax=Gigaspora margarita TaxID=4874 RepID=A0ABN7UAX7_GIGMA|nr:45680_t:CDS:2 [Gigaspora margarita]